MLYSGLLLNTLFFYETQRDGTNFVPNAMRTEPGHLKDENAHVYQIPPLDSNDFIEAEFTARRHYFPFKNVRPENSDTCSFTDLNLLPVSFVADRYSPIMDQCSTSDVGGTPRPRGHLVFSCILAWAGGNILPNQVRVFGPYRSFCGANARGITLAPLPVGVGLLSRWPKYC